MNTTTFYNKNGTLNAYGLSCGYIEKKETKSQWKQMYIEHNQINIRQGNKSEGFNIWESFQSNELTKARKFYNSIKLS